MKKIIISLAITTSIFSFSQNLKVKKGEILLEGSPIAKIDSKGNTYTFSTLDGKPVYTMKIVYGHLDQTTRDNYIILRKVDEPDRKVELNYEASGLAMDQKIVIDNSYKTYGFLNDKGINVDKVNSLIHDPSYARSLSANKQSVIAQNKKVEVFNPYITTTGDIIKGGRNGVKVGYIKGLTLPFYRMTDYILNKNSFLQFYNNSDETVAIYDASTGVLKLKDGTTYQFETGLNNHYSYQEVLERFIKLDDNFGK